MTMCLTRSGPQSVRSFGREQHRMVALVRHVHHFRKHGLLQKSLAHLLPVEHELPARPVEPVKRAGVVHRHVHLFRFVVALRRNNSVVSTRAVVTRCGFESRANETKCNSYIIFIVFSRLSRSNISNRQCTCNELTTRHFNDNKWTRPLDEKAIDLNEI